MEIVYHRMGIKRTIILNEFILLSNIFLKSFNRVLESPVAGLHAICENKVYSIKFHDPTYDDDFIFPARRLPGAMDPPNCLKDKGNTSSNYRPMIGVFVSLFCL